MYRVGFTVYCVAMCTGLCLSFPGTRPVGSWGALHLATADHSCLSLSGLFSCFLGSSIRDALLNLGGWVTVPDCSLWGTPVPAGHWIAIPASTHCARSSPVLNVLLEWGPGAAPLFPCCVLCFAHDTHTRGLCCSYGVDPLVIGTMGVPWLRPRVFFGYPGLSFLIYQVGALSLRGRKCCGIQYEAAWHLLQCPLNSCVSLETAWGPRYTHSSVSRICDAQSAKC